MNKDTKPKLTVLGTPIGNIEDISIRAIKSLLTSDLIICEDTRRTTSLVGILMNRVEEWGLSGIEKNKDQRYVSYRDQIHEKSVDYIQSLIAEYSQGLLVSDSGMPLISDPGYKLISHLVEKGIEIDVIPGPVAFTSGIVLTGLPTDRITFLGFLPRKKGEQGRVLLRASGSESTIAIYESPYRVVKTLQNALEVLGDRDSAVIFELTKLHQKIFRGSLSELVNQLERRKLKGEVTIYISKVTV